MEILNHEDLGALEELLDSHGWKLYRARLEKQLEREHRTLETDIPEAQTIRLRGSLATLRMTLNLPKTMRDELRGAVKP